MGTNCSPELSNLCLYCDEARFIDRLVREGKTEEAKKYRDSFRLIDDILHRGVEDPPDKDSYGGLEFKETTKSDGSVDFIGVSFDCLADGCLSLSVINKAASYPYPIIKFPSARSNAPARQMSSVFQGQLARFKFVCSTLSAFREAAAHCTQQLMKRGATRSDLLHGWHTHVTRKWVQQKHLLSRLNGWFRRLLVWLSHNPNGKIWSHRDHRLSPPGEVLSIIWEGSVCLSV
uniref:Uncharacterized protein n=1 Tax=Chromera velia CCMP2878 TaxID=1169474 RepID=A0A0G4F6D7_9ALVE|eukprot:Cvel_15429.t1-p1 / transcript=Cvel_15429.t1 / gene=Cvel_15429 / organism=Chromera_velia_CCMP2878 / gene_product=hypothetical protein / transcript_product=hypothetical protein / location=Cvel_scaffold1141:143-835(-) / protein_length=231 / sequence_SO=supercontig / SO=protein_coding / is_pseudo=false